MRAAHKIASWTRHATPTWYGIALLATFVSCFTAPAVSAGVRAGLTGGAGLGHMSYGSQFDKAKWSGGASLEIPIGAAFGIRSGAYWRPNGSQLASAIPEYNNTTLRFNYVAFPLGASYHIYSNSRLTLLGLGGFEWMHLVEAQEMIDDQNTGEIQSEVTSQMKSWDVAPVLGVALATKDGFEIGVQHSWGLRDVYRNGSDLKNRSLWVLATFWVDFQ